MQQDSPEDALPAAEQARAKRKGHKKARTGCITCKYVRILHLLPDRHHLFCLRRSWR